MNGIEKIIDKILTDAKKYAEGVAAEAAVTAGVIIADAETAAEKLKNDARLRAEKEAENVLQRSRSSAELIGRNRLLEAKSELIDRAFALAKQKILNLDNNEYSAFMSAMLAEAVVPGGKYMMSVNKKDRETAKEVIIKSAADITLSDNDIDIGGGFILSCGDIETNCSVELIIAGLRGMLESEVYKTLFK
jgi:V/A-type H+/Na+-transporting ATPase subunit E